MKKKITRSIDKKNQELSILDQNGYSFNGLVKSILKNKNEHKVTVTSYDYKARVYDIDEVIHGYKNVGIVYQGPVMHEDNFTLESIKILRYVYPEIKIVLSTWENELTDYEKAEFNKVYCHIIESKQMPPELTGEGRKIGHMNNQILSSQKGIEYLKGQDIEYVMKVRSDIRIYKFDFVPYLLNLLREYRADNSSIHSRVINVAFSNSLYHVPFHMTDFIWFGQVDDMNAMYQIRFRDENDLNYIREKVKDVSFIKRHERLMKKAVNDKSFYGISREIESRYPFESKFLVLAHEEVNLVYHFYLKISGIKEDLDCLTSDKLKKQYLDFLVNDVIIIDDEDILVYWNKSIYSLSRQNYATKVNMMLTHSKWLELYINRL
jgi:hypothetical protein